jgi:DNA-binding MarR family transcriptional regulator
MREPAPLDARTLSHAIRSRLPGADPDVTELLFYSVRAARLLLAALEQELRPRGLDVSQHAVLTMLWLAGPPNQLSPNALGAALVQTSGGMTKTLDRLEAAGLVERVPDPADGRRRVVTLTPLGADVVRSSLIDVVAKLAVALGAAPAGETAGMLGVQQRLVAALARWGE